MNLLEKDKPKIEGEIAIYGGRFQPFHRGHYDAYQRLVDEFGSANVYIATSNDQSGGKSPFSFSEKKEIATKMFGIPSSKFVKVNNPYRPIEVLKKYDGQTIAYIAAVGEKDAARLQGKYFKPYKGKAGYGYDEIGYTFPIPAEENPISGTDVRRGLGSSDKEKAKKFFLKAYPKFDKDVFKMITTKLNEEGFPGGIGTGLTLPGGYINGAPTGSVKELVSGYDLNPYDPISELMGRVVAEEMFEEFTKQYFKEESEGEKLGLVHLGGGYYGKDKTQGATHKSEDGKIRSLTPAEAEAEKQKKLAKGPSDAPVNEPKPSQPGQPVNKGNTAQGKTDKTKEQPAGNNTAGAEKPASPPEQKLSGSELKNSAEMSDKEKAEVNTKEKLDAAKKEMSPEDNAIIDSHNNPESNERKSMVGNVVDGIKKFGKGLGNWLHHKKEMVGGTMDGVVSLATTGKLGSVKDKEGKRRHWSEFTEVGSGGGSEYEYVETDELDSHGNPTGKKVGENKPKVSKYTSDEEKQLFEASWKESKKQKKDMTHFALDTALIVGSMALGGAGVAAVKAIAAGAGASSVGAAAAAGGVGAFTHGAAGFGAHLAKDIVKHASLEAMGFGASAAGVGAGLSTVTLGLLEIIKEGNEQTNNGKFASKFIGKVIEKMKTYKLSDEQLIKSIESYKKNKPKNDAADLLKENISETKQKSIQQFIEFATRRLKLKERPVVNLLSGKEYSNVKSSLGGYNPETKEIYVATEGRLSADICRTIAHELVHRKQDEMNLVRNLESDGADGSPIENQAHAVAGILMREYGRKNKQIYNEGINEQKIKCSKCGWSWDSSDGGDDVYLCHKCGTDNSNLYEDINIDVNKGDTVLMGKFKNKKVQVKDIGKDDYGMPTINGKKATTFRLGQKGQNIYEMGNKDVHFINVMKLYRDSIYRKRINAYLFGRANMTSNPNNVARALRNMGYDEITQMEKELNIQPNLDEINEAGANSVAADVPDGSFTSKGKKRKLDKDRPEEWYTNGGYTQTDFPKADAIFGDEDAEERTITYSIKNLPDVDYVETDFIKEGLLTEGGAYGHMSHPFDDMDLTFGDLKKIITLALNGELGVVREKTDGQALAISWKNGRLIAARNKGHLQNAGANALGIEGVASKFTGRGGLTDAYNFAMRDLTAAIGGLSQKQREKIFGEGKNFMNLEVIWPTSVNVIPYGQALLVFHNCIQYDESGNAIGQVDGAETLLASMIKQINGDVQSKYTIQGPPITSIPKNDNLSSRQSKYISKLNKLQSEFRLGDSDNVADYHQSWWDWWIESNAPVKVDKLTKESLIRRWAFGDKSLRLNTISNESLQKWAIDNDKVNVIKQQKNNIKPFEELFLGVGADVLEFVGSVLTVHPDKAIRAMKEKFKSVANDVRGSGDVSKLQKLKQELKRLNQLGGIDRIVASEGLVFFYNGKTYKLTGTFAPLNQILGIFYS